MLFASGMPSTAKAVVVEQNTNTLTARAIMDRAVNAAGRTNDQMILTNYYFVRRDLSEELDKKGAVTKRREKVYDNSPAKGSPVLREVRENGVLIPKSELEPQRKRDSEERKAKSERAGGDSAVVLTADMINRFEYELLGTTNFAGHSVFSIRFHPSAKQESPKNMNEKVLQKIQGRIYIDATAFQIVRLEAELSDELNFWGGMLGSIKQFHMLVLREPVDGIWFNQVITGEFEARAVLSAIRGRFSSTNSGFQKRDLIPSLKAAPTEK